MADRKLDEYQPKRFYLQNTKARENGFAKFEKDGAYYFALYKDGDIVMLSQSYKGVAGRDNGIESVKKNRRIAKRYRFDNRKGGKHGFGLYAGNGQEIAISANLGSRAEAERVAGRINGSVKTKRKAAPKKTTGTSAPKKKVAATSLAASKAPAKKNVAKKSVAKKKRAVNNEDNYRRLAFYKKHTKGRNNGIESFKGDDGNYYFAHFENGKIRLISEGYPTTTARDTGVASVRKNIKLEKRYDYRGPFKNGKYDYRLKAGNGKEIARSVWYASAASAATGAAYLMGTRKRVKPKARAQVKPRVAKAAPIAAAAAVTPKPRPKPKAVVPPKPVAPTPPPVAKPAAPIIAAAAAPVVAAKAAAPVVAAKAVAAPVAAAPVAAAAASGGGFGFLRWLIPLLLALLAAFFLFKFCKPTPTPVVIPLISCWDGSEAENQNACPTKVSCWDGSFAKSSNACPVEPAQIVEPEMITCWDGSEVKALSSCPVEPAPEPVVEPEPVTSYAEPTSAASVSNVSRLCGPSTNVLFDVPNQTPKTIGYLGSNPQYGNSHGLSPSQFHDKLVAAHRTGGMDQAFLNLMARSLGYSHFQDMSASDFTEETLANGSKGLLGVSRSHMLQYSKIQTNDPSHLEAFRVRSLNGTDVHIMKSCGNYMYVCN